MGNIVLDNMWSEYRVPILNGYTDGNLFYSIPYRFARSISQSKLVELADSKYSIVNGAFFGDLDWADVDIYGNLNFYESTVFCGCGALEDDGFILKMSLKNKVDWVLSFDNSGYFKDIYHDNNIIGIISEYNKKLLLIIDDIGNVSSICFE